MERLKTLVALEIEVLSPLHIGTGRTLQRGYDYTVFQKGERVEVIRLR